ncbi:hypothetical protein [Streptomyces yerevanensis]|uniref:hypothetical protein n=1 Tax=Streptomyces yerevanensis TaxID=66378 RepID=UPI00052429EA|nr:hypothetical protein [Streptomyces yerevanensis]
MSEGLTLDDLAVPLRALRLLAADFGHLPAPSVEVSTIYPDRLKLTFFDDLSGFEAWRDALGIAPDAVTYREQSGGRTRVLKATAEHAGAGVDLVGYSDVTAPQLVGTTV